MGAVEQIRRRDDDFQIRYPRVLTVEETRNRPEKSWATRSISQASLELSVFSTHYFVLAESALLVLHARKPLWSRFPE